MRSLPRPSRDQAREQLTTALEVWARNGEPHGYPASQAELDAVMALYDAYDAAGGAPSDPLKGADLDAALRTAIHDGYELTQRGRRLSGVRAVLMQGIEQCPICGISPPRVLDHYLPKAVFGLFSIYMRNLVPLCGDCNQSKGATVALNPAERFIHPYFETLPHTHFLHATVNIENEALIVEFAIDPDAGLPELLRGRLDFQLRRLRLNERYAQEINAYLVSHTTALRMCFDAIGAVGVREFLNAQAGAEFERFHVNHWRPVLLRALEMHDEFCEGAFTNILPAIALGQLPVEAQEAVIGQ